MTSQSTIWKTFREWSNDGFTITKGSKATWFEGIPKFSNEQVSKRFQRGYSENPSEDGNGEWDDEDSWFNPMDWGDN